MQSKSPIPQLKYWFGMLFFAFCLASNAGAQVLLETGFENAIPPAPSPGWVVSHTGNANWQSLKNFRGSGNALEGKKCMYLANSYYGDQSDAWLISPSFNFVAGKKYSISFYYKNQVYQKNKLEVTLGNDTTPAAQTEVIWSNNFETDYYTKAQINYTATASGINFLGIHCTTPRTYTYIYIDKLLIEEVTCFEPLAPSVPLNSITTQTAKAEWQAVEGGVNYEYGVSKSDTVFPATFFRTSATNAVVGDLMAGKQYYFYVRSKCDDRQKSNWAITPFSTAYDSSTVETIQCGTLVENSFIGKYGLYLNVICDEVYFANEFFHKFVPEKTGYYNFVINTVNDGQTMEFAYKEAKGSLGPAGWTCIGNSDYGRKYSMGPLEAGKEYYIMEKAKRPVPFPSSYSYVIECYAKAPANDSCQNAFTVAATPYSDTALGTALSTIGATPSDFRDGSKACGLYEGSGDDDIWVKFTATADAQLFRFSNVNYRGAGGYGLGINIYSAPCDPKSLVDCGIMYINEGESYTIYSYKLKKGQTYYCRFNTLGFANYATFSLAIMDLSISAGLNNACSQGLSYIINKQTDGNNTKVWVPLTDQGFKKIAEIYTDKNELNTVSASVYINSGALRTTATGRYYLDRNINIETEVQPTTPVTVRLFISNAELNKLIAQPGSGVTSINDINVTQNDDGCSPSFVNPATGFIKLISRGDYGNDYKYLEFKTTELSSFYMHGGNTVLSLQPLIAVGSSDAATVKTTDKFTVSPNPFTSSFTVNTTEQASCKYTVTVTDMRGRIIKIVSKNAVAGFNQVTIETGNIPSGIYMVKLEKPGSILYQKVVKQ